MTISIHKLFETECSHGVYKYDEFTRDIYCAKCDKWLDPVTTIKHVFSFVYKMQAQLSRHKVEMEKIEKRKRVKCQHCHNFTNLDLNLTWNDQYKFKEPL